LISESCTKEKHENGQISILNLLYFAAYIKKKNYLAKTGFGMQNILSGPFCNYSNSQQDLQMVGLSWTGSEFTW
jgi:hypothetical protein